MTSSFLVTIDHVSGLVGDDGTVYLRAIFNNIKEPSEGALAYHNGSLWGFSNEKGKVLCKPIFDSLKSLQGGRAAFKPDRNSKLWGVCDVKGNILIEPRFDDLHLEPGLTPNQVSNAPFMAKQGELWGLFGSEGQWLIEPCFERAFSPGSGLWAVQRKDHFGAIDATGATRIPFDYTCLGTADANIIPAMTSEGWGFINLDGTWCVPPKHAYARCLGEGMLYVARGAWHGPKALIAPDGKLLTDFVYNELKPFHEGRCAFKRGERWGWLDTSGQEVIAPKFFEASNFRGGRAHAGGGCIIDRDGNTVAQADLTQLAPDLSPVHHAILLRDIPKLRTLAVSGVPFELKDADFVDDHLSLARQLRHLAAEDTSFSYEASVLSIRAAQCFVNEEPEMIKSFWRKWIDQGHADAVRDTLVQELLASPATKLGPSVWLLIAMDEIKNRLDLEPVAQALISRLPVEAATGSITHLKSLIDATSAKGSPEHLRGMLQAAIAHGDVARDSSFCLYLRKHQKGPLACELLKEALAAISTEQVEAYQASGGDPADKIRLIRVIIDLLEHAALCDVAPSFDLAEHEAFVLSISLGNVDPYDEAPLEWLQKSPKLFEWVIKHAHYSAIGEVLRRHGLLGGPPDLGLPDTLPRDIDGAFAFVDTLKLGQHDLERGPGLSQERIDRITANLGGRMPPELRELVLRHGDFGLGIQSTLMDLEDGGSIDHLPIGADGTGKCYLLDREGRVLRSDKMVAPTLGWWIARIGVEAWGRRHGEDNRVQKYLDALIEKELESVAQELISRLPTEATASDVLHLQELINQTAAAGSPEHLRSTLKAAIANGDVARRTLFSKYLKKQRKDDDFEWDDELEGDEDFDNGPLACELLKEALAAISPIQVADFLASGGYPTDKIKLLRIVADLLEHAALCDVAPDFDLADHEATVVGAALGQAFSYSGEEPLKWLSESPQLFKWVMKHAKNAAISERFKRYGLLDGPPELILPETLPRDVDGAFAFVETLKLDVNNLYKSPGLDPVRIDQITADLGGRMPPELREVLLRHGKFNTFDTWGGIDDSKMSLKMSLKEGGNINNLPLGTDRVGSYYLLDRNGKVSVRGFIEAPTLGWWIARIGVEAWGYRHGEERFVYRYLDALLKKELAKSV